MSSAEHCGKERGHRAVTKSGCRGLEDAATNIEGDLLIVVGCNLYGCWSNRALQKLHGGAGPQTIFT